MVVLEIYEKCLKVSYKTCLFSKAAFYIFFVTATSIIIPFIFAYNSRGFWIKHDTFFEQPTVRFRGEYLLTVITDDINRPVLCDNFNFAPNVEAFDKCNLIKIREIDNNQDGKVDEIKFSVTIDLDDLKILSVFLLLTLDYSLKTVCPLHMQSVMILQQNMNDAAASEINFYTTLELSQLAAIYCHPVHKNLQFNRSVLNDYFKESYDTKDLVANYLKRSFATRLKNEHTLFKMGIIDSETTLKLTILIPEHNIYYETAFWQIIKWAWIQYLAIYVIFAWIISKMHNFVFANRLLLCYEESPLKKLE